MEGDVVGSSENEATRIVVANYGRFNRGTDALLISRVAALKRFIGNVSFTVFMYGLDSDTQKKFPGLSFYEVIGQLWWYPSLWETLRTAPPLIKAALRTAPPLIKCVFWRFFCHLNLATQMLEEDERLNAYYSADAILTVGGDTLTEDYGSFSFWSCFVNLLFGLLLDKPVVIYAESIGPFKHWLQ